jgi:hypothetical protein
MAAACKASAGVNKPAASATQPEEAKPDASASRLEIARQTEEGWVQVQKDPDASDLIKELTKLHTIPLDTKRVAGLLLSHKSPIGLIYIMGAAASNVPILRDMDGARKETAIHGALNEAICKDHLGKPLPMCGAPIKIDVCNKLYKGQWVAFSTLEEDLVTCSSSSINWWRDLVAVIIKKEFSQGVVDTLASLIDTNDPLAVFLNAAIMERARPVLVSALTAIGVTGSAREHSAPEAPTSAERRCREASAQPTLTTHEGRVGRAGDQSR